MLYFILFILVSYYTGTDVLFQVNLVYYFSLCKACVQQSWLKGALWICQVWYVDEGIHITFNVIALFVHWNFWISFSGQACSTTLFWHHSWTLMLHSYKHTTLQYITLKKHRKKKSLHTQTHVIQNTPLSNYNPMNLIGNLLDYTLNCNSLAAPVSLWVLHLQADPGTTKVSPESLFN